MREGGRTFITVRRAGIYTPARVAQVDVSRISREMQSSTPSCQDGSFTPNVRASLLQSRRELAGRLAATGYLSVVIETTGTVGTP